MTGTETDTFRGQRETFPLVGEDTGVNLVPGHQSTTDIFGIQTPPGVAAQIQIAYKPAH